MRTESSPSRSDDAGTFKRTLSLPPELRNELKVPLGEVIKEDQLIEALKEIDYLVSIGDMCSVTLLDLGMTPDIAVVDFKTQRYDIEDLMHKIREIGQIVIKVENPGGTITEQMWQAVERAYGLKEKVRIEVQGEEDLATLPCVWLAPENTAVIYGLPDIGLILVLDLDDAKTKVESVLKKMK